MKMDSVSSDHSPPLSENAGSSWMQCWENEISSVSGINSGSNSELNSLVEDKELAARAVAFVVNSTRKGIVPLCADVATLLRTKRSLEKKVLILKHENDVLRSSSSVGIRTSHSTSPTPPSLNSYMDKSLPDDSMLTQDHSRSCSRCSGCSSIVSNSSIFDKARCKLPSHHQMFPTGGDLHKYNLSPIMLRHPSNGIVTRAMIHCPPDVTDVEMESIENGDRTNSLPEIISEPDEMLPKISPASLQLSTDLPCTFRQPPETKLDDQFKDTVQMNAKLSEDLGSAKKEIEVLKGRLKELEMNQLARDCTDGFYTENELAATSNECSDDGADTIRETPALSCLNKQSLSVSNYLQPVPTSKKFGLLGIVLPGCKCTNCQDGMGNLAAGMHSRYRAEPFKITINGKLDVNVGDHVVVRGERTGVVKYLGHLDKLGQQNVVFAGLELDAPVGRHNGFFNGKQYFSCRKEHGVFLPLQDIVCMVNKKSPTKKTRDSHGRDADTNGNPHPQTRKAKIAGWRARKESQLPRDQRYGSTDSSDREGAIV